MTCDRCGATYSSWEGRTIFMGGHSLHYCPKCNAELEAEETSANKVTNCHIFCEKNSEILDSWNKKREVKIHG